MRLNKAFGMALLLGWASMSVSAGEKELEISVVDFTPRFLEFYEAAQEAKDKGERFALWQEHYDFVALPPGLPDRDERARAMLEEAWPDYPDYVDRIRAGVDAMDPAPEPALKAAARLLDAVGEIPSITLLYYAGMLEDNAFFAPQPDGSLIVALPAEMDPDRRELIMSHEFTHAIHYAITDLAYGPELTVAGLVLMEGVAMKATQLLFPDQPEVAHMGTSEEWVSRCHDRTDEIIATMSKDWSTTGEDAINNLTLGEGNTGMKREAYCAGWHLVERLLKDEYSLDELARIPENEIPELFQGVLKP